MLPSSIAHDSNIFRARLADGTWRKIMPDAPPNASKLCYAHYIRTVTIPCPPAPNNAGRIRAGT
jgi:hypothetical protein